MAITNGYATLSDVKASLRITDGIDDSLLEVAIESASRLVDGYCGRIFYNAGTVTRIYVPSDVVVADLDDFVSISLFKTSSNADSVYDTTWAAADYQLEPLNNIVDGIQFPYYRARATGAYLFPTGGDEATVQITGVAGWSAVPVQVKQATIIQAMRIFKRLDSPLGITFGELGAMRVSTRLDPDVAQLVEPLRRIRNIG
jgi:hypothetical protein